MCWGLSRLVGLEVLLPVLEVMGVAGLAGGCRDRGMKGNHLYCKSSMSSLVVDLSVLRSLYVSIHKC